MIEVVDDRLGPDINLCNVEPGGTFLWDEYPCIRLDFGANAKIAEGVADEHVPCMVLTSGQYVDIGRLALVTPIKVKITIVE